MLNYYETNTASSSPLSSSVVIPGSSCAGKWRNNKANLPNIIQIYPLLFMYFQNHSVMMVNYCLILYTLRCESLSILLYVLLLCTLSDPFEHLSLLTFSCISLAMVKHLLKFSKNTLANLLFVYNKCTPKEYHKLTL